MEYRGEYHISPTDYDNLKIRILRNKTNTSWLIFPNGIKNKVYLKKDYKQILYIVDPCNTGNKLIIKSNIFNTDPLRLVMYDVRTDAMINTEIEEHFDNYEPHDF